jgi:hypothetical protein
MNVQHRQVELDRRQTLTEFIKEGEVKLKHSEQYNLTEIAVTSDNKLLLCIIGQGRVICDSDPIVSMLTFLISSNSMSISLISDVMS